MIKNLMKGDLIREECIKMEIEDTEMRIDNYLKYGVESGERYDDLITWLECLKKGDFEPDDDLKRLAEHRLTLGGIL